MLIELYFLFSTAQAAQPLPLPTPRPISPEQEPAVTAVKEKKVKANYAKAFAHNETECKVGDRTFTVKLGDDFQEVDSEAEEFGYKFAWITFSKSAKPVELFPALEFNELLFLKPREGSPCKTTQAFERKDGSFVIVLAQNNRPFQDKLAVAFVDPVKAKVLASHREIAIAKQIEEIDGKLAFKVVDPPTDATLFDVTVKGQKAKTHEAWLEYWSTVDRKGSSITVAVDKDLTWKRSDLRSYFKSQEDFEKAFGWDGKAYQNLWIYRVDKPDCIQPAKERKATSEGSWFCAT